MTKLPVTVSIPSTDGLQRYDFFLDIKKLPGRGVGTVKYTAVAAYETVDAAEPVAVVTFDRDPAYWTRDHTALRARVLQPNFAAGLAAAQAKLQEANEMYGRIEDPELRSYHHALFLAGGENQFLLKDLFYDRVKWHADEGIPVEFSEIADVKRSAPTVQPLENVVRSA